MAGANNKTESQEADTKAGTSTEISADGKTANAGNGDGKAVEDAGNNQHTYLSGVTLAALGVDYAACVGVYYGNNQIGPCRKPKSS